MVKKIDQISLLYDFYGELLTEKQKEILSFYYEQDFSLGEIAEECGVSRQAVHDILKRGEKLLAAYEGKLGLVAKFVSEREKLNKVMELLDKVESNELLKEKIKEVINEIVQLQQSE